MYFRDRSAQTIVRDVTLGYKIKIKLATLSGHIILTPGRPVPAVILCREAPGRVATRVPI